MARFVSRSSSEGAPWLKREAHCYAALSQGRARRLSQLGLGKGVFTLADPPLATDEYLAGVPCLFANSLDADYPNIWKGRLYSQVVQLLHGLTVLIQCYKGRGLHRCAKARECQELFNQIVIFVRFGHGKQARGVELVAKPQLWAVAHCPATSP